MKRFRYLSILLSITLSICLLTTACGKNIDMGAADTQGINTDSNSDINAVTVAASTTATFINTSEIFSNRDLSGEYDESKCDKITLSDTGAASDSKGVVIDGSTVTISKEGDYILSGTLSDGMIIIDVDKTEKVQLVLNGVNINSDTSAAIYVKNADKVFVTLADGTVNTLSNGGSFMAIDDNNIDAVIFSKDDLTLNGTGSLTITSPAGHGVVSKDDLVITNGGYDITASSHGLAGKDSVAIADGSFNIEAGKDAIHSANDDDNTVGNVYIGGGTYVFDVESDGISAINEINIAGGSISIDKSYEGIEGRSINISGGRVDIISSDDGLNATDKRGTTDNATGGNSKDFRGGMMNDIQSDAIINISGGIININAEGDGIDSNGYITMSGGEIYVSGPSNGGNGALDYGIDAVVSGGIIVAAGQSNMAQNFGYNSTQGSILVNTQKQNAAGSDITLLDSEGNTLVAWTIEKSYNSVVVSCPEITAGKSYTLITGETTTEITMDGLIYGDGFSFGGHSGFGSSDGHSGAGEHGDPGRPGGHGGFDDSNIPDAPDEFKDGKRPFID
ncbi:MAG: carbohydrate-binding domain-containing protein [Lachnospiraceae bacterium]|nr:carbohydrate-binding domain-containing protein [Lachnospiraceae bacterium]